MDAKNTSLHLNQSNLQDFQECPRRFQLKVIDRIEWPAPSIEPLSSLERSTELGNKFHQLCHQYFSGIDSELIEASLTDPDLKLMWENFLPTARELLPYPKYSEIVLSTSLKNHHLVAKFDLVLMQDKNNFIIYDWKTASRKPPRSLLAQRFQTILYPFIFLRSGNSLFSPDRLSPPDIHMHYYYPLSEDPEEIFPYSDQIYAESLAVLETVVNKIDSLMTAEPIFPLTEDRQECLRCEYRSLCERGTKPAAFDPYTEIDQEDLSNVHFELDSFIGLDYL